MLPIANPAGQTCIRPIGSVGLSACGNSVELSDLMNRVVQVARGLDGALRLTVPPDPGGGADAVIALRVNFS